MPASRFTDAARKALAEAKNAARELGASAVGSEHMLLGLLRCEEGMAYEVLTQMGITSSDVAELIRKYLISNYSVAEFEGFNYSPMSNRILQSAVDKPTPIVRRPWGRSISCWRSLPLTAPLPAGS
ncbi:MAG: Clp protease N-terminal domain-containing protein [Lachnospiraceae bacterium]|nr:Clp protease N-terminal domain-containing protein [Lachnospiraceae bacterium]